MRRLRFTDWVFVAVAVAIVVAAALVVSRPASGPAHSAHQRQAPVEQSPAAHSDGLSESENGYRFERVVTPETRGVAVPVAFRIIGADGPVIRFQDNQTKQVHLFAVREDMHVFQHAHPTLDGDTWRTTLALPDGGAYRMFAQFIPLDSKDPRYPVVLGVPFSVPGDTAAETVTDTGYTVTRLDEPAAVPVLKEQVLRFAIRAPDGSQVRTVQPHLGANGHLIGFHTTLLSVTHLHPTQPMGAPLTSSGMTFHTVFAERGEHRLFLEFSHGGKVHTAPLTVVVVAGS